MLDNRSANGQVIERRITAGTFEIRHTAANVTVIEGHAAVFNSYSQDLGGFVEQVAPGAFAQTIQQADVRALFNHDPSMVLGRSKAGTLRLSEDSVGLNYQVDLPNTAVGRDLAISMARGDITQSSFGFRVLPDGDTWSLTEADYPLRTLTNLALMDVSPVTYPAYLNADVGIAARALSGVAARKGLTIEAAVAALPGLIREGQMMPGMGPDMAMPSDDESLAVMLSSGKLTLEALLKLINSDTAGRSHSDLSRPVEATGTELLARYAFLKRAH